MQKVMQQVLMIMQVRWDTEDGTNTNTERGSILVITWKEDMVANISRKHVTATFSSKMVTIHYWVKLAGHLKEALDVRINMTTSV